MTDTLSNHAVSRNDLDLGKSNPKYTSGSMPVFHSDFIFIFIAKSSSSHISGHLNLTVHPAAWLAHSWDMWNVTSQQQHITWQWKCCVVLFLNCNY